MDSPRYGLVGRGRLARHMSRYLSLEGCEVVSWHRGLTVDVETTLAGAEVLLLAISDDAIEPFDAEHPALRDRPLVHFSGSLVLDGITGLHPLMSFGPELYELDAYRSIPFITERGGVAFDRVFPTLRNPCHAIDPADKPLYHALCVLSGNVTTVLWAKAMDDFESRLGLPRAALKPFLQRTAGNTIALGAGALTGSLARGDVGTIERDLAALDGDAFAGVYRAVRRAVANEEVLP